MTQDLNTTINTKTRDLNNDYTEEYIRCINTTDLWEENGINYPAMIKEYCGDDINKIKEAYPIIHMLNRSDCHTGYIYLEDGKEEELTEIMKETISDNKELMKIVVPYMPRAVDFASDELKKDRDFALCVGEISEDFGYIYRHLDESLKNDPEVAINAYKSDPELLCQFPQEWLEDKALMLKFMSVNGMGLMYLSDEMKDDTEVVRAASENEIWISEGPDNYVQEWAINFASERLQEASRNSNCTTIETLDRLIAVEKLTKELNEPKVEPQIEEKSAKDKYLEDFSKQNQATPKTKSGGMKI